MAPIQIPYMYRFFKDAPITTWIEKQVQSSSLILFSVGCFTFLPLIIGLSLLGRGMENSVWWSIMIVGILACLVLWIAFPFIIRGIWIRKKIAQRLACLEAHSGRDPETKPTFKRALIRKLCVFLIPWVFFIFCCGIQYARPIVYDHQMHAAFEDGYRPEARGEKCAAYIAEDDLYTVEAIPAEMRAYSPRQVGFILRITRHEYLAGYTLDYNMFTNETSEIPVYMYSRTVEWISCVSGTVVKTQTIEGDRPTTDTPLMDGIYYGSDPLGTWSFEYEIEKAYEELTAR